MKKIFCIVLMLVLAAPLFSQTAFDRSATDAFMITRMAEKFHLQPKPLNPEFSIAVFDGLLKSLDDDKVFFTKEDIAKLNIYRNSLDKQVLSRNSGFLKELSAIYLSRLQQADTMILSVGRSSFDLNVAEKFLLAEDSSHPANSAAQKTKLRKLVKYIVMEGLLNAVADTPLLQGVQQKKFIDSLEVVYRKRIVTALRRSIAKKLESPGGIPQLVGETYCEVIAAYYDPHTNYLPLTEKENLESELGQKIMAFGFKLDEDDHGRVYITELKPGSPAYQSGQLNEGDKLVSVQWLGKSVIDVADASLREVLEILGASNHEKVRVTVLKADNSQRVVELSKAKMEDDSDADKVKSFLLKGEQTLGYISLPAFYEDWENGDNNVNGCANDVAREIIKLKKENITGLILDLRYNGGGSLQEAVELSGIFIDAGPVGQIKDKGTKVITLKDANRGTIYDGPLLIMVNGYSASASEFVAATLQDYNRAVIVGSPTYGKATSQVIFPMDTTINIQQDFSKRQASSYMKITLSKIYRVNGATAQFAGVEPDVLLPDIIEAESSREADMPFAIPATGIEANKYYKPLPPIIKDQLRSYVRTVTDTSAYFIYLKKFIAQKKQNKLADITLNWKEALTLKNNVAEMPSYSQNKRKVFEVVSNAYDQQRLTSDKDLKELQDAWKNYLLYDPYLQITYELALKMIK